MDPWDTDWLAQQVAARDQQRATDQLRQHFPMFGEPGGRAMTAMPTPVMSTASGDNPGAGFGPPPSPGPPALPGPAPVSLLPDVMRRPSAISGAGLSPEAMARERSDVMAQIRDVQTALTNARYRGQGVPPDLTAKLQTLQARFDTLTRQLQDQQTKALQVDRESRAESRVGERGGAFGDRGDRGDFGGDTRGESKSEPLGGYSGP